MALRDKIKFVHEFCDWLLFAQLDEMLLMIQLLFESLDWVVHPIRGIRFLFGCKNIFFSIDGL